MLRSSGSRRWFRQTLGAPALGRFLAQADDKDGAIRMRSPFREVAANEQALTRVARHRVLQVDPSAHPSPRLLGVWISPNSSSYRRMHSVSERRTSSAALAGMRTRADA